MKLDAHCHTDCSDGCLTIEDRIKMIRNLGFDAATITDHDFVSEEQVRRARDAAGAMPFIPGIELTLAHEGRPVHILGFFIDPGNTELQRHITRVQNLDQAYTTMLLEIFRKQGALFGLRDLASPSLHTCYSLSLIKRLGGELFRNKRELLVEAVLDAFDRIGAKFADLAPWPVQEGIRLIHNAGGISVLAHPGGIYRDEMRKLGFLLHDGLHIKRYTEWGLDGIEAHSPCHSREETKFYSELAVKHSLIVTAGSDCHGNCSVFGPATMGVFNEFPENLYEEMLNRHSLLKRRHGKDPVIMK
jgi:predicted metal-dependent phosphoesterase TrpH